MLHYVLISTTTMQCTCSQSLLAVVKGEVPSGVSAGERVTCSHAQTGPLINAGVENELSAAILAFVVVEMLKIRHAASVCVEKTVQIVKVL